MAKSLYLTPKELKEFTGYEYSSKQIKWLESNNVPHFVNGAKKPVVLRATLTNQQPHQIIIENSPQPNFEGL